MFSTGLLADVYHASTELLAGVIQVSIEFLAGSELQQGWGSPGGLLGVRVGALENVAKVA